MTGFEPRISGVGRDRSTNCATTMNICNENDRSYQGRSSNYNLSEKYHFLRHKMQSLNESKF